MNTTTRRDAIKAGAGFVIGATLAGGTAPVEATQPDRAALFAWEGATTAADARGLAWVKEAKQMHICVQLAVWQAEEIGEVALLESLRSVLAGAEALHEGRAATFQRWADQAWNLPDLAPLPAEPWALLPAEIGEDG
ncbi:MAG: hypothetical protein M3R02_25830 [Chloroflexota bacterium]|nr:hypothetical protein [Chloroflexota bacterium]